MEWTPFSLEEDFVGDVSACWAHERICKTTLSLIITRALPFTPRYATMSTQTADNRVGADVEFPRQKRCFFE